MDRDRLEEAVWWGVLMFGRALAGACAGVVITWFAAVFGWLSIENSTLGDRALREALAYGALLFAVLAMAGGGLRISGQAGAMIWGALIGVIVGLIVGTQCGALGLLNWLSGVEPHRHLMNIFLVGGVGAIVGGILGAVRFSTERNTPAMKGKEPEIPKD